MNIQFTKMHGLGNDFMVIDAVNQSFKLTSSCIQKMSNRHRGIGFDQLLLIEPAKDDSYDFFYRIYNADGSEAYQCGNGARCIAKFIHEKGLSDKKEITVSTLASHHQLILLPDGQVKVDMGLPILAPEEIPFVSDKQKTIYTMAITYGQYEVSVVSMGNPHCIFNVDNVNAVDLKTLGKTISEHPNFPERTNVEFMQVLSSDHIRLRIYERGVGETEACGSGACATVVAGVLQHKLGPKVLVTMPGGDLLVEWQGDSHSVWMTGPAATVFEGQIMLLS